ncbi:hypothetical protein B0H16DRAFT_1831642 [Mycena metata]|uniref:Uncharacterized protein n=1 Tax=Mycena metata TaxID=1033252 RepID=A0AAD7J139_9AGAR|nr:hypothetical protein B0H16DRAFT_1831642 [Mycena metata]
MSVMRLQGSIFAAWTNLLFFLDRVPSEEDSSVLKVAANLAVLHGVFKLGSADSAVFLAWLKDVVDVAVTERRNVRPVAPGKMVPVGFNAGPRHAQVFGLAKSFTKLLDNITKTEHHSNIIAATTTVWAAAETWIPTDITHHKLKNIPGPELLPVMDWVQRAPPEAYLTVDYSA